MNNYLDLKEINTINNKDINKYNNFNEPIVLRNNCKNTIAYKTWNIKSIIDIFRFYKFPIEIYSNENDLTKDDKIYKKYSIKKIINHFKKNKKPHIYCAEVNLGDYCEEKMKYYFNKIDLTKNIPEEYLLFLGNNSKSGCHLHIYDNYLLNQIFGKKTVYLFNYFDNKKYISFSFLNEKYNFINENFFKLNHSKMKIYKVTLNPGDSLIIPPWWWHATEGHNINCSVTFIYLRSNINYLYNKPFLIIGYMFSYIENYLEDLDYKYKIKLEIKICKIIFLLIIIFLIILILFYFYKLFFKNK